MRSCIRGTKSPFEAVSAERMLRDNLIANNSGNLLFLETAWKLLSTTRHGDHGGRLSAHRLGADRINERFDAYVIPLANAFRRSYMDSLIRLTRVIERLTIPVIVLGVGVQSPARTSPARSARSTMRSRHSRGPSSTGRRRSAFVARPPRRTCASSASATSRSSAVPRCSSMATRMGVTKSMPTLDGDARIGMDITPTSRRWVPIVMSNVERYPNLEYLAQDIDALRLLLWGETSADDRPTANGLPIHLSHPLLRDDKSVFFVDPWPWLDYMRETDFVFGSRIHGNIAAMLSGHAQLSCSPTIRARWSSPATSRSRTASRRTSRPTSTPPTSTRRPTTARRSPATPTGSGVHRLPRAHGLRHVFEPGEDPTAFDRARVADGRLSARGPIARAAGTRRRRRRRAQRRRRSRAVRSQRRAAARPAAGRPAERRPEPGREPLAASYAAARRRTGGTDPGPAGSACRPRPCRPGVSPRLPAGRLRHAQASPRPWSPSPSWRPRAASSASSQRRLRPPPAPPQHHQPDRIRRPRPPSRATPYGDVTFQDPGSQPARPTPTRTTSRPSRWTSTPPRTRSPSATSPTATCPTRPASASRSGSTRSTRTTRRPADGTFAVTIDGGADPVPRPGRGPAPGRHPGPRSSGADPPGRRPDVRHRHLGLDGPASDRLELVKDVAAEAGRRPRPRRFDRGRRRSATTPGSCCRRPARPTTRRSSTPSTQLQPGGSTNLEAGLRLGYELARETLPGDGIDRVVLASDGVANVGLTDADGILRQIRDDAAAGIELVSVGVGMGNYNDVLLEQLADQGDGFYAYVNDLAEARAAVHRGPDRRRSRRSPSTPRSRSSSTRTSSPATGCSATRTGPSPTRTSATGVDAGAIGAGHA